MNILFTICGRAGSRGIKNKNLSIFLGYPLSFYTYSAINLFIKKNSDINCELVLNTDSIELAGVFSDNPDIKADIIKRQAALAGDNTPKSEVILNCLRVMEERKLTKYDIVADLDITAPLRSVDDIERLIAKKVNSGADVVFSVTDSRRNPYFNMVKKSANGYERVISSEYNTRQEAPEIFDMNASMYAYSPEFLKGGRGLFEGTCDVIKMRDTAVLDLDKEEDFELMQVLGEYFFENYTDFKEIRNNISTFCRNFV